MRNKDRPVAVHTKQILGSYPCRGSWARRGLLRQLRHVPELDPWALGPARARQLRAVSARPRGRGFERDPGFPGGAWRQGVLCLPVQRLIQVGGSSLQARPPPPSSSTSPSAPATAWRGGRCPPTAHLLGARADWLGLRRLAHLSHLEGRLTAPLGRRGGCSSHHDCLGGWPPDRTLAPWPPRHNKRDGRGQSLCGLRNLRLIAVMIVFFLDLVIL
eukprot:scaffold63308_cov34-Prasinocladus_malaysianus.AAC.1